MGRADKGGAACSAKRVPGVAEFWDTSVQMRVPFSRGSVILCAGFGGPGLGVHLIEGFCASAPFPACPNPSISACRKFSLFSKGHPNCDLSKGRGERSTVGFPSRNHLQELEDSPRARVSSVTPS